MCFSYDMFSFTLLEVPMHSCFAFLRIFLSSAPLHGLARLHIALHLIPTVIPLARSRTPMSKYAIRAGPKD